jgi:DMSO/TMAO reductase YedYZ heme-binding membrane subunit
MSFPIVLACSLLCTIVFKDAIRKAPGVFYAAALALSLLYAATGVIEMPLDLKMILFLLVQKGTLATALFVIVMYMGVCRDVGFVRQRLMPIRATLSIIACILILGHVLKYTVAFAGSLGLVTPTAGLGLFLGAAAFILMSILGLTSIQAVKKRMTAAAWFSLQRWAYLFYGLLFAHLALFLVPANAGTPDGASLDRIAVYGILFGLYAVLRPGKALANRRRHERMAPTVAETDLSASEDKAGITPI